MIRRALLWAADCAPVAVLAALVACSSRTPSPLPAVGQEASTGTLDATNESSGPGVLSGGDANAAGEVGGGASSNAADAASIEASIGVGLSSKYPCDTGLAGDPAVYWLEDFEEGTVSAVTARYDSANNPPGMALVTDVPATSCGRASMKLTAGTSANATDLYKKLVPAHDEWYVRYYAKYQRGVTWHHTGVWIGGYAPPSPYPNPQAGLRPNGDDRFSVSIEPVYGVGQPNPRFDFYNYWMGMHSWMDQPQGPTAYYGNSLVHRNSFTADDDTWICIEVHVKLNTDLASSAGAVLEVWKNDALVQRFDESTPVGCWIKDKFCPAGVDGSECTAYPNLCAQPFVALDLQWRSTSSLQLDAFWPQNYITQGPDGSVQYDDMVVAASRVGCH
jgi:hypothetical protein